MRVKLNLKYFVALLVVSGFVKGQTESENYVYSKTYLTIAADTHQKPPVESVTYFDGLGRPKQTVLKNGAGTGKDLVTPIKYDGFGRQTLDVLPVPVATSGNDYHTSIVDETSANSYYSSPAVGLGGHAYSEKTLESSPLDRVLTQSGPGDAWSNNGKKSEFFYETNGNDVKKYIAQFDYPTFSSSISLNGTYASATLYKNRVKDEDGNTTIEYKNGKGQTIMVRKIAGSTISQGIAPIENNIYADTYYVYNNYDQLAYVIPPLAVAAGNTSTATLNNLCYQYIYDGKGRLVEKKLPGKGWEYMVYDRADRLILTRDEKMAQDRKWLVSKYDKFGRVVYTGITPGSDRDSMQSVIKDMLIIEERESNGGFVKNGMTVFYSKHYYTDIETVLSVNYYDTYPANTPYPSQNKIFGEAILPDNYTNGSISTQSLPTASFVKNINDDRWTKNYTFYDEKGRPIGTESINHLGGSTVMHSRLDLSGTVTKSKTFHKKLVNELPVIIEEEFVYDDQNRLLKHYHEVLGKSSKELLAENEYNEIGTLKSKKVGVTGNSAPLQTVNYNYNIRGWLTGINLNQDQDKTLNINKLFSYKIRYDNATDPSKARFNGNISQVDWTFGLPTSSRYDYTYDSRNRLLKADFKTVNATITTDSKFFNEELKYDLNGNITELKRFAKTLATQTFGTMIDHLSYAYGGTNAVTAIADATGNASGYKGIGLPITYDVNGNMLTFPDKGITQNITYNYLNLPETIVQNNFPTHNIYRADGVKVHKTYAINGVVIDTYYLDGFVYTSQYSGKVRNALIVDDLPTRAASSAGQEEIFELEEKLIDNGNPPQVAQSAPKFFPTAEGFYDFENFKYIYHYKDHLGNVRLSYSYNSSENKIDIEDTNNYYPFGLSFITENFSKYSPSTTYKNYKYNGKELQETGMYDYGARFYMPDIGRWGVVDPLTEKSTRWSPYTYGFNNPIRFVDPDGRQNEDIVFRGTDKKELRVIAAGPDKVVNVPFALNKNTTLDVGIGNVDPGRLAIGFTAQGDVGAGVGIGGGGGVHMSIVQFTDKTYSGYNYVYAGAQESFSMGAQANISGSVGGSVSIAYNTSKEKIDPKNYAGITTSAGVAADAKILVGGGVNVSMFSGSGRAVGWKGVSIGASLGVGAGANLGSGNVTLSKNWLINDVKPTAQRSVIDRVTNELNPVGSAITTGTLDKMIK